MKGDVLINISGRTNAGPEIGIEMARAFALNGYNVYAVVAAGSKNISDWKKEKLIKKIVVIETYNSISDVVLASAKFAIKDKSQIKKAFEGIQFDFVLKPIFHIWSEIITNQVKTNKVITMCHDPIMHSGENIIKRILYRNHIKHSDELIVFTRRFITVAAQKYGFEKEAVHYMPLGLFHKYKKCQSNTFEVHYDSNNINFLFFGRVEDYKGISILLEAYNLLQMKFENISLTIAGKGNLSPYATMLQEGKNVNIVNEYIPDEHVGCYFDGPNVVVVLPYLDATQSGVIPIAMEYGVPIIASDTGGLREQLDDGNIGLFVKPNDANELTEKMEMFLENTELYNKLKFLMKQKVMKLEWATLVREYLGFLEK